MIRELLNWVEARPEEDQIQGALEEVSSLIQFIKLHGSDSEFKNLKSVLNWVWVGGQLPLEFFEARLQDELRNENSGERVRDPEAGHHSPGGAGCSNLCGVNGRCGDGERNQASSDGSTCNESVQA